MPSRTVKPALSARKLKVGKPIHHAPLGTIAAGAPFEILAIDLMGPLPTTSSGNSYIMVVIDYYTKWMEAFPLKHIHASDVAKKLVKEVFFRYGTPEHIHTDQGPQFESHLFQELCSLMDIHKTRTTPYHPQCDGLVERSNRTIQNILRTRVNASQKDWDTYLPSTVFAYNTSVHSVTEYTPYFLMFGREARTPLHLMFPLPEMICTPPLLILSNVPNHTSMMLLFLFVLPLMLGTVQQSYCMTVEHMLPPWNSVVMCGYIPTRPLGSLPNSSAIGLAPTLSLAAPPKLLIS